MCVNKTGKSDTMLCFDVFEVTITVKPEFHNYTIPKFAGLTGVQYPRGLFALYLHH
jgi:hypothetical protein